MSEHLLSRSVTALIMLAVLDAAAQAAPGVASESPWPAITTSHMQPHTTSYQSAFDGYQSFTQEELLPWRQANDTVHAIGGWRAYAKEASDPGTHEAIPRSGDRPPVHSTP